ncbi:MAG: DUF6169 family protein [Bacteroidia bacterium]
MHYNYICEGDSYYFVTDQSLYYKVSITHTSDYLVDDIPNSNDLYSISFDEISSAEQSGYDSRVFLTIEHIIKSWFEVNNKILYYICSNADGRAEKRFRLFTHWFRHSEMAAPEQFCYNHLIKELDLEDENCYVGFIYSDAYPAKQFIEDGLEESLNDLQYK